MNYEQLKNSILQEAIEGRLVPQNPSDEPAAVLLRRIREEKARLVKEKKIKKDKNESTIYRNADGHWMERFEDKKRGEVCIDDEIPFEIPESWEWTRIGTVFNQSSGKQQSSKQTLGTPQKFITTSNVYWGYFNLDQVKVMNFTEEEIPRCSATKGDLLVCEGGAGYGRSAIWDKDYDICLQNHVHRLRPYVKGLAEFAFYLMYLLKETNRLTSVGTAMPGLSASRLNSILLPLPPLSEQHRIVSRIEEIMPKVESYGKAQERLDALNAKLPKDLKNSILQEAIEGRLVPQDPKDEPAAVLLQRIRQEKARLVKEKKIKKDKNESIIYRNADGHWIERFEDKKRGEVCIDDEIPFEIPESWEWCRLQNVCQHNPNVDAEDDADAAFMPMAYLSNGISNDYKYDIRKWKNIKNGFKRFQDGDMAFAKITPCFQNGKSFIAHDLPNHVGAGTTELHVMRVYKDTMDIRYLYFFIKSPYFMLNAEYKGTAGQQRVLKSYLDNKLFPLPPLPEQHRIVSMLESLLPKVERL